MEKVGNGMNKICKSILNLLLNKHLIIHWKELRAEIGKDKTVKIEYKKTF